MRNIFFILIFITGLTASAQNKEEVQTLFGKGLSHPGYFLSPTCQIGQIAGSMAVVPGVGIGVVFNKHSYLSLVYKYIATENTPVGQSDNSLYLDQRWGGVKFEYALLPEKTFHLSFPLEAGMSHVEYDKKDSFEGSSSGIPGDDASFAYLEPGVALELNIHKYVKLNFSATYRFVSNVTFGTVSQKDLMGLNFALSLKIGIF